MQIQRFLKGICDLDEMSARAMLAGTESSRTGGAIRETFGPPR
jgi:hypothetical protein